ncbi:F-box only 33 [Brachionus plicatilis]|uniref:F-box only 33 n=1 Tax=Brachionus plicatilis TaxID=10195 RepID=A0A3M7SS06_BRAPC|nr:F-box only 33 [Brachionus plicatilis]
MDCFNKELEHIAFRPSWSVTQLRIFYMNTKSRHTNNKFKYDQGYTDGCHNYKSYRPKNQHNSSSRYYRKFFKHRASVGVHRPNHVGYHFSMLPNIVLNKIYSYLDLKDRLNASLVCKHWRLALFNPSLWQNSTLTIYLLNRFVDIQSSEFKIQNLSKFIKRLVLKYDPNDLSLFNYLISVIVANLDEFKNLTSMSLQPIFYNLFYEEDYFYEDDEFSDEESYLTECNLNLFNNLINWCSGTKLVEHLSLGLVDDMNKTKSNLVKLVSVLGDRHANNLRSLHLSTSKNISSLTLQANVGPNLANKQIFITNYLFKFNNLTCLSIDYEHLTDDFLQNSSCCLFTLKKLNLNVNSIDSTINENNQIKDESWSIAANSNKDLRVTINFIQVEESTRKYGLILSPFIPLEAIRMYFCKSLNPDILQFISNSYSETLQSMVIVDAISDPSLQYHNPLRHEVDPDPLVLLCWKCKYLTELVLVGYEILEINLIAIAKLRDNLKTFYVAMDCIIDLKYGKFKNDNFIEDEDGEDTIVDYGFCSEQSIRKVCKILRCENWHPLEKDELPMCVYNFDMPYEEAYLEKMQHHCGRVELLDTKFSKNSTYSGMSKPWAKNTYSVFPSYRKQETVRLDFQEKSFLNLIFKICYLLRTARLRGLNVVYCPKRSRAV